MRTVFGAVSLLVALSLVAFLAARPLKSVAPIVAVPAANAASTPAPGNVVEQVRQAEQQVGADVAKALEQGAAARNEQADK